MYRIGKACGLKPFQEIRELLVHDKDQTVHPVERRFNHSLPRTKEHIRIDLGVLQCEVRLKTDSPDNIGLFHQRKKLVRRDHFGTAAFDPRHLGNVHLTLGVVNNARKTGNTDIRAARSIRNDHTHCSLRLAACIQPSAFHINPNGIPGLEIGISNGRPRCNLMDNIAADVAGGISKGQKPVYGKTGTATTVTGPNAWQNVTVTGDPVAALYGPSEVDYGFATIRAVQRKFGSVG